MQLASKSSGWQVATGRISPSLSTLLSLLSSLSTHVSLVLSVPSCPHGAHFKARCFAYELACPDFSRWTWHWLGHNTLLPSSFTSFYHKVLMTINLVLYVTVRFVNRYNAILRLYNSTEAQWVLVQHKRSVPPGSLTWVKVGVSESPKRKRLGEEILGGFQSPKLLVTNNATTHLTFSKTYWLSPRLWHTAFISGVKLIQQGVLHGSASQTETAVCSSLLSPETFVTGSPFVSLFFLSSYCWIKPTGTLKTFQKLIQHFRKETYMKYDGGIVIVWGNFAASGSGQLTIIQS